MRKIIFMGFAAVCFAVTAHAQSANGGGHGRGYGGGDQRMVQALNLTPEQQAQFRAIDSTEHVKTKAVRNSSASEQDKRQAFMAAMKDGNDQKRAILTPDQQTKWDQMQAERKEHMQQMRQKHSNDAATQSSGGSN